MAYGLLLLRVVVGGTMFSHGAQKLFGWFGGHGLRGTAGFFGSLGWRMPLLMAFLAGLAEASGLAFALGIVTPLAALGIAIVMLNAIIVVHWRNGFFNGNGGIEFPARDRDYGDRSRRDRPRPVLDRPSDRVGRQHQRRVVGRRRPCRGARSGRRDGDGLPPSRS